MRTTVVIVGAGPAGLAMSRCLTARAIDHVLLERSDAAHTWRSGRPVTLAVGNHTRLPRTYRGRDIHWWMDAIGLLDERHDEIDDPARARRQPSPQLVGSPQGRTLDLNALSGIGVELVGRFVGVVGNTAQLSGSLAAVCAAADLKQGRLLDRIDAFAAAGDVDDELGPPHRPERTLSGPARTGLDLRSVGTVIWATGYAPRYPWLDPGLLDHKGALRHHGGVLPQPGMYVLGLPFTRRRKSSFLDGFGPDAEELAARLTRYLDQRAAARTGSRGVAA